MPGVEVAEAVRCIEGEPAGVESLGSMRWARDGEGDVDGNTEAIAGGAALPGLALVSLRCLSQKVKAGFFFAA